MSKIALLTAAALARHSVFNDHGGAVLEGEELKVLAEDEVYEIKRDAIERHRREKSRLPHIGKRQQERMRRQRERAEKKARTGDAS